jgi:hypothetical protein
MKKVPRGLRLLFFLGCGAHTGSLPLFVAEDIGAGTARVRPVIAQANAKKAVVSRHLLLDRRS